MRHAEFLESGRVKLLDDAPLDRAAAGRPPDQAKMAEVMRRHGLTPAQA